MNILLWVVQALLAAHTAVGAGWKLFNPAATVPSLAAIPAMVWLGLAGFEIVCALALVAPAIKPALGFLVPLAALGIALEMLLFIGVHLQSGAAVNGQVGYWLVVALVCAAVAAGRYAIAPH
jgi:hypothetical protein